MSKCTIKTILALCLSIRLLDEAAGSSVSHMLFRNDATNWSGEWSLTPWIRYEMLNIHLGQISGVSLDQDDNIYLFHRADRVWDDKSFTSDDIYTGQNLGPISKPTILIFNSNGDFMDQMGLDMFFIPHGITVDRDLNVWVTDVALHQVMKLPQESRNSTLTLGTKFVPGNGPNHFCKPTSVAVTSNGDFFVADGYCNSRIIKFNSEGRKILEWGRKSSVFYSPQNYDMNIPHALTLADDEGTVCAADRENGRIMCYRVNDGVFSKKLSSNIIGNRIFSVAYSSILGGVFFVVNGKSLNMNFPVGGFVLNSTETVIGKFGDNLNMPHDIAVSSDACNVYVVEIGPYSAWKYVNKKCNKFQETLVKEEIHSHKNTNKNIDNVEGLTGALLVTVGCFVFAIILFMAVIIYSKSKRSVSSDTKHLLSNNE